MVSQIENVLATSLPSYKALPKDSREELWSSVMRYVFRVTNASEFAASLRGVNEDYSSKRTRLLLLKNGTILKNLKLFAYASAKYSGVPRQLYKINEKDEGIVLHCLDSDRRFRGSLHKYLRKGFKPLTLQTMNRLVNDVIKEVDHAHVPKFVHKKLRFVIQSTGIEASDLKQDLYSWGAYSIYKAYPQIESFLHAVNIAKRAIHNRGINIIMENTSQSRLRYIKNDDGTFGSKHVPLHAMLTPTGTDEVLTQCNHMIVDLRGNSAQGKSINNVQEDSDLKIAIQQVYSGTHSSTLKHLMKLWSGQYDKDFSEYLEQDNDEWYEEVDRKEYMCECARYLKVGRKEATEFYQNLRSKLKVYN